MTRKPWAKMTTDELAEATKEFDTPGIVPRTVTPSKAEQAKHRRAGFGVAAIKKTRGRGRPKLGGGAARVLFTIDPDLLFRLDAFARKHGMKRSVLIARAVEGFMATKPARKTAAA